MFGWLFGSDSCPVDPHAKAWIEDRLIWLRDEFGADDLYGGTTILPTPQFFPDPFDGTRKSARDLFDRVCEYMGADPTISLKFFKPSPNPLFLVNEAGEAVPSEAAGLYEGHVIRVNEDGFVNVVSLVGTMAHELAHQRLLGEARLTGDEYDNELLTDLTVVFKGLGIFLVNVSHAWEGDHSPWPGTTARKPEYMTGPMLAYAMAVLAWCRCDDAPWRNHIHFGMRGEFRQAMRFLNKTGDVKLKPLTKRKPGTP